MLDELSQTPKQRLAAMGRECFERAVDMDDAADQFAVRLVANPDLRALLLEQYESQAIREYLRSIVQQHRAAVWAGEPETVTTSYISTEAGTSPVPYVRPTAPDQRINALSAAMAESLLSFPLPQRNGKLHLGDATRDDLQEAYQWYSSRAKNMGAKAKWISAIMDRIGNHKVREVLSGSDLRAIQAMTGATLEDQNA